MSPDEDPFKSKMSQFFDLTSAFYLIICAMLSLVLNGTMILTIVRKTINCDAFRIYLFNMAVIDILMVLAFPMVIISSIHHQWMFGEIGSMVYAAWCFYFGLCSISTLALMALARFIKTSVVELQIHLTTRNIALSQLFVYVYSAFWACMPLVGFGRYAQEPSGLHSSVSWAYEDRYFAMCLLVFCFMVPLCIMAASYIAITFKIRNKQAYSSRKSKSYAYMMKLTFAMCFGFLISWFPYAIAGITSIFASDSMHSSSGWLTFFALTPIFAKSCVYLNPVIYFVSIKSFREGVRRLFDCVKVPPTRYTLREYTIAHRVEGNSHNLLSKSRSRVDRENKNLSSSHKSENGDHQILSVENLNEMSLGKQTDTLQEGIDNGNTASQFYKRLQYSKRSGPFHCSEPTNELLALRDLSSGYVRYSPEYIRSHENNIVRNGTQQLKRAKSTEVVIIHDDEQIDECLQNGNGSLIQRPPSDEFKDKTAFSSKNGFTKVTKIKLSSRSNENGHTTTPNQAVTDDEIVELH